MATIHPSRLGLVPHEPVSSSSYSRDRPRGRSPSPRHSRHRSPSPRRRKDRSSERRTRDGDDVYQSKDRSNNRRRRDNRSHSAERPRGREDGDDGKEAGNLRRASPVYEDYRNGASEGAQVPWRQGENMYPRRFQGGYGGGSIEFMDGYVLKFQALRNCIHASV